MRATVVRAVRGAITVDADQPEEVRAATAELLREVLARNALEPEDLISILFTATPDLVSEFPAVAARQIGLSQVPLMCAQEIYGSIIWSGLKCHCAVSVGGNKFTLPNF